MQPGLGLLQGRFDGIQGLFRLSCCIFGKFSGLEDLDFLEETSTFHYWYKELRVR